MIPVVGDHSARIPAACGSISRIRSRPDLLEALDAVGHRPARGERRKPRQLVLVQRDDELAAVLEGDAVLLGERLHRRLALAAQARLERPGRVVQAGVQHAAVVARLVRRQLRSPSRRARAAGPGGVEQLQAVARPTIPPPTMTMSVAAELKPAARDGRRARARCQIPVACPAAPSTARSRREGSRTPWRHPPRPRTQARTGMAAR